MIKVLVVEDEQLERMGLVMTTPWDVFDCQVVGEAANGLVGLDLIAKLKPEIVITDIRMPGMDGIDMIQKARQFSEAEFIIISGYSEFDYAQQAVKLGVRDYLLKPIDDQELAQVLGKLTAEIRNRKQYQKIHESMSQISESRIMLFKEYLMEDEIDTKENYVRAAIEFIKQHYAGEINIKDVADHLHISESYISRLFKNETNYTFIEYLTYFRIKKAIELLKDKSVKIYEITGLVGYNDARYFSAIFKKYVGVTPTEFKDGLNK